MKKEYGKGFVPALGTPVDENGNFLEESFIKQCKQQKEAGAIAFLAMGSMGVQPTLKTEECPKVAKAALKAAEGKIPVYVGAMDCSIVRCAERMKAMEDLPLAGFVFTVPFYNVLPAYKALNFFRGVAKCTAKKIYLYDLPVVSQSKITFDMVKTLLKDVPNLGGIKTADLNMIRKLMLDEEVPADFEIFYSGLDTFDIAYGYGVTANLDGMFTCTPENSKKMYRALAAGDEETAAKCLTGILFLRDKMASLDLMPAYSAAMNLLGCHGRFHQDYCDPYTEKTLEEMREAMKSIGELA